MNFKSEPRWFICVKRNLQLALRDQKPQLLHILGPHATNMGSSLATDCWNKEEIKAHGYCCWSSRNQKNSTERRPRQTSTQCRSMLLAKIKVPRFWAKNDFVFTPFHLSCLKLVSWPRIEDKANEPLMLMGVEECIVEKLPKCFGSDEIVLQKNILCVKLPNLANFFSKTGVKNGNFFIFLCWKKHFVHYKKSPKM